MSGEGPRYARKKDDNQDLIVEMLHLIPGVSVTILSGQGEGIPDLMVGEQIPLDRLIHSEAAINVVSRFTEYVEVETAPLLPVIAYNWLFELKDGDKALSKQHLTTRQIEWHGNHRGQVHKVNSIIEILRIMGHMDMQSRCLDHEKQQAEAGKGK